MNILITGSNGFIGRNLKFSLLEKNFNIFEFNRNDNLNKLENLIEKSDIIFHLAGENRPKKTKLFKVNNIELTNKICSILNERKKKLKIIFTSTTQIKKNNLYAKSKLECEKILIKYKKQTNNSISILRLPNVYGKWSKPNYNSVVATFCYNIIRNKKIKVHNKKNYVNLYYIDDLLNKFMDIILGKEKKLYPKIDNTDQIRVDYIAKKLREFNANIKNISLNNLETRINKNLYSTFISFLTEKLFLLDLKSHKDSRGNFVEFIKSKNFGQISYFSINVKKERGGHYHHSKVEQFLILKGNAKIKYVNLFDKKVIIKKISGKNMKIFRTMPGYVHTIVNIGKSELIGIVWANETFNIKKPDTFKYHE